MFDSFAVRSTSMASRRAWMPWLICLSAGLFFFYEFFQLNVFDVINQSLRADFQIDATQLSWMSSTYVWANVLFLLPAGVVLDRFSIRFVILMAMLICVVGTLGFALTHSFAWAAFFHSLTGIGNAFCFLSCVVLVSRWFPPRRQALVIGCLVTMAFMGGMMAHTPLAYLNASYGWRNALLIDSAVGALILIWIFIVVHDKQADSTVKVDSVSWLSSFSQALGNRQNWYAGLYTACLNLPIMVLCALWGASYLQEVHHLSGLAASNAISLIFMGSIVGCPLVGWFSDYQGRRKPVMIVGALATMVTLIPLFLDVVLPASVLSFIFFALGFFTSTQVISYPLIAESNTRHNTGLATGLASVIIMGGGGIGQIVFGFLMQRHAGVTTQYVPADFQSAMWMFPIAVILALVAILMTQETKCTALK